jgi:mannitol-1-phosphate 5-dehydrogenase
MLLGKKIVVFGAGRIGRSFIGQVFNRSGYEVVLVDIDRPLIDLINQRKQYKVVVKDDKEEQTLWIKPVRGCWLHDTDRVVDELAGAGIASLSVGQQGLQAAIPVIAKALTIRRQQSGDIPLDIIIAENMRNADVYIRGELSKQLPPDYPIGQLVGLIETSIGKMVPIITRKDREDDPLQVFAEPYNSLIVAKKGFKNPVPDVPFLVPKENIKAWVDRKLFIHNLGHAVVAYTGYLAYPEAVYIYELLEDKRIFRIARQTMLQSAEILQALYPGEFTPIQLEEHIDDLLRRFMNRSLGDTVFRVGCDLYRKLSPEDRLAAPVHAAIRTGKPYNLLLDALIAAVSFRAKDENGRYFPSDIQFFEEAKQGTQYILEHVCGINIL